MTFAIHLVVSGKKIASFGYLIFSVMLPFLILFSASVFATQRQMFCRHLTIATHRRQDAGAKHVVDATFATPVSSLSGGGCPQWVRRVRYPRVGFKRNRPHFVLLSHIHHGNMLMFVLLSFEVMCRPLDWGADMVSLGLHSLFKCNLWFTIYDWRLCIYISKLGIGHGRWLRFWNKDEEGSGVPACRPCWFRLLGFQRCGSKHLD